MFFSTTLYFGHKKSFNKGKAILDIELEFPNAFPDVVHSSMVVGLLVEQIWPEGVEHRLERRHIQNAKVQEVIQVGHLVKQEVLVLVDRVP